MFFILWNIFIKNINVSDLKNKLLEKNVEFISGIPYNLMSLFSKLGS